MGGWIGFDRFMDLALFAPGLGYYSGGAHKFGPDGDFVTAPEISPLFGKTLARQVAQAPWIAQAVSRARFQLFFNYPAMPAPDRMPGSAG